MGLGLGFRVGVGVRVRVRDGVRVRGRVGVTARDERRHHASRRLDAQRERRHVDDDLLRVTREGEGERVRG